MYIVLLSVLELLGWEGGAGDFPGTTCRRRWHYNSCTFVFLPPYRHLKKICSMSTPPPPSLFLLIRARNIIIIPWKLKLVSQISKLFHFIVS